MNVISSLAMVAILLSGCATPNEMRQGKPSLDFESTLTSKDAAKCIFDKWENDGPSSLIGLISMRDLKNGYMVAFAQDGVVYFMADVSHSNENNSRIRVFANSFGLPEIFSKLTNECQ